MTEQQISYRQCVVRKSRDVYLTLFGLLGKFIYYGLILAFVVMAITSLLFLMWVFYVNWSLIIKELPAIPTIPWYVYAVVIIVVAPAVYSAVWCLAKRNDEKVKTE